MKRITHALLFSAIILNMFSCNKLDDGEYVDPITVYEKINGKWTLANLTYVDLIAQKNGLDLYEQNLSNLFNFDLFKIQLNVDENNKPSNFEISGDIPPIIAKSGYWKLDNEFQPTTNEALQIELYSDQALSSKVGKLLLTSIPSGTDKMQIQLVRSSNEIDFLAYQFNLLAE